jgi:hypothetical protein
MRDILRRDRSVLRHMPCRAHRPRLNAANANSEGKLKITPSWYLNFVIEASHALMVGQKTDWQLPQANRARKYLLAGFSIG